MKKVILASSLLLSIIGISTSVSVSAANVTTVTNINNPNINVPGVKINRSENTRASRNNRGTSNPNSDEFDYPQPAPPPGSASAQGQGVSSGGFTGSKPVSVPSATPQPQMIQLPQSMNDLEEGAKVKKSQGQIPFEPPTLVQGNLQSWNTSTINELESAGKASAERNYRDFRAGRR